MDILSLAARGRRLVPTIWKEAPIDIRAAGFVAMVVLHLPVKREWSEASRQKVALRVAQAALAELQACEVDLGL